MESKNSLLEKKSKALASKEIKLNVYQCFFK